MSRNDELNEIKEKIENMDKKDHIEILNIFKKFPNIILNENNNAPIIKLGEILAEIRSEPNAALPTKASPFAIRTPKITPTIPPIAPNNPDSIKKNWNTDSDYLHSLGVGGSYD